MSRFRILITGSRDLADASLMREALLHALSLADNQPLTVVHGDCRGADRLAVAVGRQCLPSDTVFEAHPADWAKHGKAAGPIRNRQMVELGASVVLAFYISEWPSRGTTSCVNLARQAGLPVLEFVSELKH